MSKKRKKGGKQEKNSKKTIIKIVLLMFVLAILFAIGFIYLLTPNVREISFFYSDCTAKTTDTDIPNRKMSISIMCKQKNLEIKTKNAIAEQIASLHVPLINSIRFKFEAINKSTSQIYSGIDPTKFVEAPATIICNFGGRKIPTKYEGHLPVDSLRADFLTLAEIEKFYTDVDQQIEKQCEFVGDVSAPKMQIKSATSTEPVPDDAFWVAEAGAHIPMKAALKEIYSVQLHLVDSSKYILFISTFGVLLVISGVWSWVKKKITQSLAE
jgi:hypothetical protein